MFKKAIALAAVFAAVAQASLAAGGEQPSPNQDSKDYSPVQQGKDSGHGQDHPEIKGVEHPPVGNNDYHPMAAGHGPLANSSYSIPSLTPSGSALGSSSKSAFSSVAVTSSAAVSSGYSSSASKGFPSYTNSSTPSVTLGPSITTKIITTTVTSTITVSKGIGPEASTEVQTKTLTETITSTITVCTKCVEVPKTSSPAGSPGNSPEEGNSPAENQPGSETLTYTVGSGPSKSVITTTIKNTKTVTNTHTVTASPSGENSSPETSPENACGEGEDCVTETQKITKTSTQFITAASTCPPQVTVTVPGPDVTVTVTAMEGPPSGVPGGPGGENGPGGESSAFPTVSSAPYGNFTLPGTAVGTGSSSTRCTTTGFITRSKEGFPEASAHAEAQMRS